jgi:cytochrome c oxidase subunit IV
MTNAVGKPLIYTWLFLAVATIASWWLGHGAHEQLRALVPVAVLTIAVVKCRVVIRTYMDVKRAPSWLQLSCDAWLILNLAMASSLYWK